MSAGEPVHLLLDDVRAGGVEGVAGLAGLEVGVGVLGGAAQHGRSGESARGGGRCTRSSSIMARRSSSVEQLDLGDFVRGAEAVEEVQEGHAGLQRGGLGDQGEVLGLLHRVGGQHGEAGLAAGHDVGVVAEDGQGVGGQGAGGDVHDEAGQLAGDLVHVGDHQQQALRRGEGRGQGAGLQGAVDRAGGAAFGLHLDHLGHRAPDVGLPSADHSSDHSPIGRTG